MLTMLQRNIILAQIPPVSANLRNNLEAAVWREDACAAAYNLTKIPTFANR